MSTNKLISVAAKISRPLSEIWDAYINPEKIIHWNFASNDWICPRAELSLEVNGKFSYRMESRETKEGFDFSGKFLEIRPNKLLRYQLDDGRKVTVNFLAINEELNQISVVFEAENTNTVEQQTQGWQSVLNNFKQFCENQGKN